MDNNEVYALFEDIKNGLKGINDRLENAPKVLTVPQRSINNRRKPC